jgi:hypothetical protein
VLEPSAAILMESLSPIHTRPIPQLGAFRSLGKLGEYGRRD